MTASERPADAQTKYWRMRRSTLLSCLSDAEIKALAPLCETRVIERGALVYDIGEASEHVFLLESGSVKVSRMTADGREANVAVLGPLDIFGELALAGESARLDCARTLAVTVVCAFESEAFERYLSAHAELALQIAKLIGIRLRRAEGRIQDILFEDVRTRLAHMVARLADKFGEKTPEGTRIGMRLTQTDLAHLIGSTRETTSTIFNEFRRDGLVDNDGHYIIVRDQATLSSI